MVSLLSQSPAPLAQVTAEVTQKLAWMRQALTETGAAAVRLRGIDWFAWATAGASNIVLLAAETGVAEVLVTPTAAWILTDEIEAPRLRDEEIPPIADCYALQVFPWAEPEAREAFVRQVTGAALVLSDRPIAPEQSLPAFLVQHKRTLLPSELDRYRRVCQLASSAMTEVLTQARPEWTEYQLAAAGAAALWKRGIHPALTLAAGERRLPLYRHATPSPEPLGQIAMLVFCARGFGLYANLTRFVAFSPLTPAQEQLHHQVRVIEAMMLNHCKLNMPLNQIYLTLQRAYAVQGYPQAIHQHHQGGTTGYLAREIVATPDTAELLLGNQAIAWNPSLPGAKIEDTFVLKQDGQLENLTFDATWPNTEVNGRFRPLPLFRP